MITLSKTLKDAGVSLDLKKADAEGRSKAAIAMQAAKKPMMLNWIKKLKNAKTLL